MGLEFVLFEASADRDVDAGDDVAVDEEVDVSLGDSVVMEDEEEGGVEVVAVVFVAVFESFWEEVEAVEDALGVVEL